MASTLQTKFPSFYPTPQLAHISDGWENSPLIGAFMHGAFGILLGLFSGLSVLLICQGLQRRRMQTLAWVFYAAPCVSILSLILLCFIELIGSCDIAMAHFYYGLCLSEARQESMGDDAWRIAHWEPCVNGPVTPDERPWMRESLLGLQLLLPLISDGIIVHRTQLLVQHRAVSFLLHLSWIFTFGTTIGVIVLHVRILTGMQSAEQWSWTDEQMAYVCALSSTICNLFATICVGVKLWLYRRDLTLTLGFRKAKFTRSQKILVFLIESGSVYCFVQVVYVLILTLGGLVVLRHDGPGIYPELRFPDVNSGTATYVCQQLFTIVSGLYPAIILLVINLQILYPQSEAFSIMSVLEGAQSRQVIALGNAATRETRSEAGRHN